MNRIVSAKILIRMTTLGHHLNSITVGRNTGTHRHISIERIKSANAVSVTIKKFFSGLQLPVKILRIDPHTRRTIWYWSVSAWIRWLPLYQAETIYLTVIFCGAFFRQHKKRIMLAAADSYPTINESYRSHSL